MLRRTCPFLGNTKLSLMTMPSPLCNGAAERRFPPRPNGLAVKHTATLETRSQGVDVESPKKKQKKAKKWGLRPKPQYFAVGLRRSDLGFRPPPWKLRLVTTLQDLELSDSIMDLDCQKASETCVSVLLSVDAVGEGYYLKGQVLTCIPMLCPGCQTSVSAAIDAKFEVWLNGAHNSLEVGTDDPYEIAFPPRIAEVDLTWYVADCIADVVSGGSATASCCGREDCRRVLEAGEARGPIYVAAPKPEEVTTSKSGLRALGSLKSLLQSSQKL